MAKTRSDVVEDLFLKLGSKRKGGTLTATQTGARQLAGRRERFREFGALGRAVQSSKSMEDYISGKDPSGGGDMSDASVMTLLKRLAKQRQGK